MADLALRFGKDMLVVSSPIQEALLSGRHRVGVRSGARAFGGAGNHRRSLPHGNGGRPAVYGHPHVADFTPARLVAVGAEGKAKRWLRRLLRSWRSSSLSTRLWKSPPAVCRWIPTPRRRLWKIADQYAGAPFRCLLLHLQFFLNGFTTADDLKCALTGLRKVTDAPSLLRWMCRVTAAWRVAGAPGARPWK